MKYIAIVLVLIAAYFFEVSAVRLSSDKTTPEESQAAEADLDALMDKYDDKESAEKKAKDKKNSQKATPDPNAPMKEMIQDQELKILSGNFQAESSAKSSEDDVINEALDKVSKQGKGGDEIIAKDDAKEACNDIYEKLRGVDSYTAIDKINEKFDKIWNEHDVTNKTFLERTEAYNMVQDITRL